MPSRAPRLTTLGTHSATSTTSLGPVPSAGDFGVAVDEPKIEKQCKAEVAQALGQHLGTISFKVLADSTQGFKAIHHNDANLVSQVEGKKVTPLIKWFEIDDSTYWMGFRLGFKSLLSGGGRYITAVSIMVARSFASSSPEPVLRAEWGHYVEENAISQNPNEHAQPHWHVYPSSLNASEAEFLAQLLAKPTDDDPPTLDFDPDALPDQAPPPTEDSHEINDFHFAMCAHWNKAHRIVQWPLTEEDLAHWIRHCLAYIRSELESTQQNK